MTQIAANNNINGINNMNNKMNNNQIEQFNQYRTQNLRESLNKEQEHSSSSNDSQTPSPLNENLRSSTEIPSVNPDVKANKLTMKNILIDNVNFIFYF